jgi:hypothetical protein
MEPVFYHTKYSPYYRDPESPDLVRTSAPTLLMIGQLISRLPYAASQASSLFRRRKLPLAAYTCRCQFRMCVSRYTCPKESYADKGTLDRLSLRRCSSESLKRSRLLAHVRRRKCWINGSGTENCLQDSKKVTKQWTSNGRRSPKDAVLDETRYEAGHTAGLCIIFHDVFPI